ncbi:MAG TPA: DUF4440 domain-containing protein [Planctomycetaceae bacterium]|jgi:calcium/calmodulin-dependent protein kinase (CaM kinase) II|nr:DUF4440 domain-containing protein [Rhodopirellula sp.]MCH2362176.1 DUF4440 domain-containing protein [Pirellulales bacterium]HAL13587.1 DUF4440 domain-containing protein [Planctomycetaceae bacterium]HCK72220.1 DUF4440 domain-containing protein [Planctomycetaceae bacterium]HCP85023.1 DUF4440 domain-containing protein [Planctomycetaceae bacterium]|tara:strand:- start:544 stop:942 length:399 start_codon:yes stop_codon:yes gene_type:complete
MTDESQLVSLSKQLLDSIDNNDWDTYIQLCDPSLSAYEPEALGNLVEGLDFHAFYMKRGQSPGAKQSNIAAPKVRMLGPDAAVVTYIRVVQRLTDAGDSTATFEETRVWQKVDDEWKHVHFHRSYAGSVELG